MSYVKYPEGDKGYLIFARLEAHYDEGAHNLDIHLNSLLQFKILEMLRKYYPNLPTGVEK